MKEAMREKREREKKERIYNKFIKFIKSEKKRWDIGKREAWLVKLVFPEHIFFLYDRLAIVDNLVMKND